MTRFETRFETWAEVADELVRLGIQPARFCRRCDLSESTYHRGLKNGSALQPSTASVVNRIIREIQQEGEKVA